MRITINDLLIRDQFKNRALHESEMVGKIETSLGLLTSVNAEMKDESNIIYNDDIIRNFGGSPVGSPENATLRDT